jgi:hypothetical protein
MWRAMLGEPQPWHNPEYLEELRFLCEHAQGWVAWDESLHCERFFPMSEWAGLPTRKKGD